MPLQSKAAHLNAPVHHISMEFDLETNSLSANSRIELPAGMSLQLDLSHLDVSRILVNGQPGEATQVGEYLDIHESTNDQELLITYNKKIPPGLAQYSLISETGITLSDHWYPVADREVLFKLTALIPADFEAVSEAEDIISFQIGNKKQVTFRFPHPLVAINFVAGPYSITRGKFGEEKDLVAYFFPEDQELAAEYLEKARQYLDRYEKMLGPYPYKRFSIVENRLPTGFAMPTFTLLGQAVVRLPFIVDTSLGHEVLHAWFGNGVRMSSQEGNWVEGLTTYLADQAFAADKKREIPYRKEQLVKYQSYVRPDMDLTLRDFSNVGHGHSKGRPARAVGYNKSSMFFHMLQNKVGPEVFTSSLRDFYKRLKYKSAGWSDLQTSFESISGMELNDFFSQWLDRNDVPEILIQQLEVKNNDGYPVLSFDIVQKNNSPYALELSLIIKTSSEEIQKTLSVSESSHTFEIPLTSVPETLIVDPEYDVMRALTPTELPPTWSRFLGAAKKLAILPSEEHRTFFEPLLKQLEDVEGQILMEDEVTDKDLAENSLLFLGTEGRVSRSLFAIPDHPAGGFTLDVRINPLNADQAAVLVSSANEEQVEKAAAKLRHYGKYSYLSFKDGRIRDKRIAETDIGIQTQLVSLPAGIEASASQNFDDIIAKLLHYQVIYIGEGHTDYEDHILQLEIIRALYKHDQNLAIGMEMFTRSTQTVLDQYMKGDMDEKSFLKESHYFKMWRFDYRLYRDIINFARHNHLPLIALNLERDTVSQVFKNGGPISLPDDDISSLPANRKLDLPGYRERIESAYMMHAGQAQNGGFSGFFQAQALWDETMAETIADYMGIHPDTRLVIIAGRGHVDKNDAIPPRVSRRLPVSQAVVINSTGSTTESETADFIFFSSPANLSPFPLLGVMLEDTENGEGALVSALNPQGQAKQAGIKEKDIILAIDSDPVNDMEDVKIAMLYKVKSDAVTVQIKRRQFLLGDKIMNVEVSLKSPSQHGHMGRN
ncbi:ChaN family lipoprotein [Thermodesulfobacteriota bacterium]